MDLSGYLTEMLKVFDLAQNRKWRNSAHLPLLVFAVTIAVVVAAALGPSRTPAHDADVAARARFGAESFKAMLVLAYSSQEICRRSLEPEFFGVSLNDVSSKSLAGTVRLNLAGPWGRTLSSADRINELVIKELHFTEPVKIQSFFQSRLIVKVQGLGDERTREINLPFQFVVDGAGQIRDCIALRQTSPPDHDISLLPRGPREERGG